MNDLEKQYEKYIQGWTDDMEAKLRVKESLIVTGCCLIVVALACWMLYAAG